LENYANVNIQNKNGETPLFLALENNHRNCAKVIIIFNFLEKNNNEIN
jgi:ankyrin repeat protein